MHACRITFEAGRHLDLLLTRMAHTNLTGILCTSNLWSGEPIGGGGKIARVQTAYLEHRANCGANYLGRVFENLGPMSPLCCWAGHASSHYLALIRSIPAAMQRSYFALYQKAQSYSPDLPLAQILIQQEAHGLRPDSLLRCHTPPRDCHTFQSTT